MRLREISKWAAPLAALLALVTAVAATSTTALGAEPPLPETDFAAPLNPKPCKYEGHDPQVLRAYKAEGWKGPDYVRYPGACERLRFAFGPILVKPGQNDVFVNPVAIESPRRNGYITRFRPNLVLADGTVPPVERMHLHHGTWLSEPSYGNGPFFASGEEKTIAPFPRGYGLPVKATDQWYLLYMVHSAIPETKVAYITYDIDFIPKAKGDALGIRPAYPIWLDVRPSPYPVFNVQRKYGGRDGRCTWPKQECAGFDPWGHRFEGQGTPGNGVGTDWTLPGPGGSIGEVRNFRGGTLIGLGGHLHPGGLKDKIDLVRNGRSKRILTSEAVYWNHRRHRLPGGPPTSWDLSMTVTGLPYWGIRVRPNDTLRINATYDTRHQASYEDMGIAVGLIAPNAPDGKPTARGINPFRAPVDRSTTCRSLRERLTAPVTARVGLRAPRPSLCDRGTVTHGHQAANGHYGGPSAQALNTRSGARTNRVAIANFQYRPGDLSSASASGVPTVKLGTDLRFTNLEGGGIYHSITTCRFPCLGQTGAAFPIANGQTSSGRSLDLDSGELAVGAPVIGPAKQTLDWDVPVTQGAGFRPGEVVTYYCRIHPFMRGAFKVTR